MRLNEAMAASARLQWNLPSDDNLLSEQPKFRAVDHEPLMHTEPVFPPIPVISPDPPLNVFLRSPLPGITVAPDSLRQFYRRGIPQARIIPPSPL